MRRGWAASLLLVVAAAASGCSDDGCCPPATDAGDAGDAGDARVDAGDAGVDAGDVSPDAPAGTPLDRRGTPVVSDPGMGAARAAAGFYRLSVEAWGPGLTFPEGRRTLLDFYYSSEQEVFSSGLGGKLMRLTSTGTAAVYQSPMGDQLQLHLERAQQPPHFFTLAALKERGVIIDGTRDHRAYPTLVNKIADPPFAGGPTTSPATAFVPPFFGLARGMRTVRCTAKTLSLGTDATFRVDETYRLEIGTDGKVSLSTERGAFQRTFDEARDTHVWPDAATTAIRLVEGGGDRVVIVTLAEPGTPTAKVSVAVEVNAPPVFASYTLSEE